MGQRTLVFQQIADSRFGEDDLTERTQEIIRSLALLPTVNVQTGHVRKFNFPNGTVQRRVNFYVTKGRSTTWGQIYEAVNAVKAVHYHFTR